jgi:ankyrin repeat protein
MQSQHLGSQQSVTAVAAVADLAVTIADGTSLDDQLWDAAKGDLKKVQQCRQAGASIIYIKDGLASLHIAATSGALDVCEFLLQEGAPVDMVQEGAPGNTPLHFAVQNNHLAIVQALLAAGANTEALEGKGEMNDKITPLWNAVRNDQLAIVQALLGGGANVHYETNSMSILGVAVYNRKPCAAAIVAALCDAGADPNRTCAKLDCESGYRTFGMAPLHLCALNGDEASAPDVAQALIRAGADPNAKVPKLKGKYQRLKKGGKYAGETPMFCAYSNGKAVIPALEAGGAKKLSMMQKASSTKLSLML